MMRMPDEDAFGGLHDELTSKVIGAFYSVATELGTGFLEAVYRRALCIELRERGLKVQEECPIGVIFHGQSVGVFQADIVVEGLVILELKTADEIIRAFEAQLLHYLRATRIEVGLILAFGMRPRCRRVEMRNEVKGGLKNRNGEKGGTEAG